MIEKDFGLARERGTREIPGNLWNWEGIARASGRIGEIVFKSFGTDPNNPDNYRLIAQFIDSVKASHSGELLVPNGPMLSVRDGIDFLAEDDEGVLVNSNFRPVTEINNIPYMALSVSERFRNRVSPRRRPSFDKKVWECIRNLPQAGLGIGPANVDFPKRWGSINCYFDFTKLYRRGQGKVLVKLSTPSVLAQQRMRNFRWRRRNND